jgi:hypothetical protein
MSRAYRRRGERHDYDWVLREFRWINGVLVRAVAEVKRAA